MGLLRDPHRGSRVLAATGADLEACWELGAVVAVAMFRRMPWATAAVIAVGVLNAAGGVHATADGESVGRWG